MKMELTVGSDYHKIELLYWEAEIIADSLIYAQANNPEWDKQYLSPQAFVKQFCRFFKSLDKPEPIIEK